MHLDPELKQRIKRKELDRVEDEWISRIESSGEPLEWFLEVARELRAAKCHERMVELVGLLAEELAAKGLWEEALDALREGIALAPRKKELRAKVCECLRARFPGRANLAEVLAHFRLEDAEDPLGVFDALRDWLRFEEGAAFWLFGRGLGLVAEANVALEKIQVRFEKSAPLAVRADEARKLLTFIPPDHFLRRRLDDPEGVRKEVLGDPGACMRELLRCFGRPLTAAEVRECMREVIGANRWSAWWARARSHPQVLPEGDRKNSFVWSESSEAAERALLQSFEHAPVAERMEMARKHAGRGGAVERGILEGLRGDLARLAPQGSAQAVELAFLLEELGGLPDPSPVDADELLRQPDAAEILTGVQERRYRERLYRRLRRVRPEDWYEVCRAAFFEEGDFRLMSRIYEELREGGAGEVAEALVSEVIAAPRRAPRPFVWVVKNALHREELRRCVSRGLLAKVVSALESPEFRQLRGLLKEQFAEGGVAFAVFENADRGEAEHLLNLIDGASGLEEHRKTAIRRAIFRRFPHIRKRADDDVVFGTAEAVAERRRELERLVKREIPENAEAIRVAREHGDLRENFEYHAARQRHEVLSSRAARLDAELRRVRIIDPDSVDSTRAGIGTRVELESPDGGERRAITILGPWDSRPEEGVYSYLSEFAQALLGRRVGDIVLLEGREHRIAEIRVWKPPDPSRSPSRAGTPPIS